MKPSNSAEKAKFPVLKTLIYGDKKSVVDEYSDIYYSIKFYPFLDAFVDPVFAVVGGIEVYIIRPNPDSEDGIEILQHFVDDNKGEVLCTSAWTKDKETGKPLLAVGGNAGIIKILDVTEGKVQQVLVGHGDEILDLQVSPQDPLILASASADTSVRLWSLDPAHKNQPCAAILSGEAHRETILTIAFHKCGKYLLSSGMDHTVNLWVLPDLPDETTGTDKPRLVRYPHFATTRIHSNYVDMITFFGDLIISKAAKEHKIVLWKIQNFSSKATPPTLEQAPTTFEIRDTRSAFGGTFDRLLQFQCNDTEPFYMQFGLFARGSASPILAMGSTAGKVYFWDINKVKEKCAAGPGSPFSLMKPQMTYEIPRIKTAIRQVGWSVGGDYMVAVGDKRLIAIFHRP